MIEPGPVLARALPEDAGPLVRRLLREEGRRHARGYLVAFACMAVGAGATAGTAYLMRHVIDGMVVERDFRLLRIVAITVAALYIAKGFATWGQAVSLSRIGSAVVASRQRALFDHLMRQDLAFFHARRSSEVLTRIAVAANGARDVLNALIASIGRDVLSLVGLVAVMIAQDPKLTGLALLAMPVAAVTLGKLLRRVRRHAKRSYDGVTTIMETMLEAAQGARVVKTFGLEGVMRGRMDAAVREVEHASNRIAATAALASPVTDTLGGLTVAAVIMYGGWRVIAGGESPGAFFSFIAALLLAYEPAKRLGRLNLEIQNGLVGVRLMYELLDQPAAEAEAPGLPAPRIEGARVEFQAVRFAYPGRAAALDGLDLVAEPGRTTALVGPSGGGKSTALALIPRLYRPDGGRVLLDGQDVGTLDLHALRRVVAVVGQEAYLFRGTVGENIALGRPGASAEAVRAAARAANAAPFIEALPRGYDTEVGEVGALLSGGQRQRLAIARAILKDAPLLLLDEPTAALDGEAEREVQRGLDALRAGRTTLVVAHRLATVVNADRIFVIEGGRVVESGRHAELLARRGRYHALYAAQARGGEEARRAG